MIARTLAAQFVNEVINHPSIHPWVCGPIDGPLDVSESIENGSYIALMGEHGGFLFWHVRDGVYDAHSAVLPEGRGMWALESAHEALRIMFSDLGATEIMMAVPAGNVAVRALVRCLKAKLRGKIEDGWWRDGKPIAADIYSMTKTDFEQCLLPHR